MILTAAIVELANGELPQPVDEFNTSGPYSMFNTGSVEVEMAEFLYGLIRVTKPQRILTTGTYWGVSDLYMAQAMKDNGLGLITAIEYELQHLNKAIRLWQAAGVMGHIEPLHCSSLDYYTDEMFDLLFLDTEPGIRFTEFEKFVPSLKPGGFVIIHDLHRHMSQVGEVNGMKCWPYGEIPPVMKEVMASGEVVKMNLPIPRGCTMLYKVHGDDYAI